MFPLYLLWKILLRCGNVDARKFIEDLKMSQFGFFKTMYLKRKQPNLTYCP